MKYLTIALITILSISACKNHQGRKNISKTVDDGNQLVKTEDDGETLNIKVRNYEKHIDFKKSFGVKNMTEAQKKMLKTHILDSLGIN